MKKTVALILALLMMVAGCMAYATAEEAPRKISIALGMNANVEDYDTNLATLYLENKYNVDIEFFIYEDAAQKLPIVIGSGSELPDIIWIGISNADIWNYAQQGAIIPLTEYWKDPECTTHFDSLMREQYGDEYEATRNYIISSLTMPDGNIYAFPTYTNGAWSAMSHRAWINQEWLDKLGLEVPTTTDEFKDVLYHFVNDDPNGNGIADEAGLVTMASGYGSNPVTFELNAFIHANPDTGYINVVNGEVVPAFTQDEFKEGLEYIHDLYSQGLIAPESFTQDQTQFRAMINVDDAVAGIVVCGSHSNFTTDLSKERYKGSLMSPIEGPDGVRYTPTNAYAVSNVAVISRDCKDPDFCFSFLESQYNWEDFLNYRYGPEGEYWSRDPEICEQYLGIYENAIGVKTTVAVVNNVWGTPNNVIWNTDGLFISYEPSGVSINKKSDMPVGVSTPEELHMLMYSECKPAEILPNLMYTDDELSQLAMVKTAIDSYVTENITAFATGNRSFDDWDAYLSELESMQLETYISIVQAAYDRAF